MGTQVLSCVGQHSLFGRQSVFCGLHNVQMQQASMKTRDTAHCADATSKHETRDTANYADATSKLEDKRHYSTQGSRAITQPSTS